MATDDSFDDILRRAEKLTPAERRRLAERLRAQPNGEDDAHSGRTLFDAFQDDEMLGSGVSS